METFYNIFKKKSFFLPSKSWKKHPQKLPRKTQIHFFSLLPAEPKHPKQNNSCSKMWPIALQMFCLLNSQMNACKPNLNTTCSDFNRLKSVLKNFYLHAIFKI